MRYKINLHLEVEAAGMQGFLRNAALQTLQHEQVESGSMTLVVTDEETIQRLNKEFADLDQPTDVLAFEGAEDDPDNPGRYYGDVIIALAVAERQAQEADHSIEDELSLLTVHGTLHLLGYDHATSVEKNAMWAAQSAILDHLGVSVEEIGQ